MYRSFFVRVCMLRANKGISVKSHRQSVRFVDAAGYFGPSERLSECITCDLKGDYYQVSALSSVVGTSGLPNYPLTNSRLPIPMLRGHLNQTVESFVVCCCMVTLCHSSKANRAPCELQHVRASGKLERQCVRTMPGEQREAHRGS